MQSRTETGTTLNSLLEHELDCARTLLSYLQQEATELAGNNPEPIAAESTEKVRLLEALQQATQARLNYLAARSRQPGSNPVDLPSDADANAGQLFDELLHLARQCFEENRRIGQLINRRTRFITQVLESLAPSSPNPKAETYEQDGNTTNGSRIGTSKLASI